MKSKKTLNNQERNMAEKSHNYERIALACQGGGSLGAYHIGAYEAMEEAGYIPEMFSGISIGAFTAAILAGNAPKDRVAALKGFWDTISWPEIPGVEKFPPALHKMHNKMSSLQGFIFGQPNFFEPRNPGPKKRIPGSDGATSFYDTSKLHGTLLKFVNFDIINSGKSRLILGATRVKDSELVFFDSAKQEIGPEHVMASGSMPPGFPGMEIDGDLYWDGGCVSNTPLQGIFDAEPKVHTLAFMIDLFNPNGAEPMTMDDVDARSKQILYSSRTRHHIDHINQKQNLKKALHHLLKALPATGHKDSTIKEIKELSSQLDFDIVHVVYDAPEYEVPSSDCEFSKFSIEKRREHGYRDLKKALDAAPWLESRPGHVGSKIYKS